MNAMKIVAPALFAGLALTAVVAHAQSAAEQWPGQPGNRIPGNPGSCSLSRSCAPGPSVNVIPYFSGRRSVGTLHLQIHPSRAEVYVDGMYAGWTEDFDGASGRADLQTGRHRIEIRAEGYETLRFETRIEKSRTTVYRATLQPALSERSESNGPALSELSESNGPASPVQ
jgi:hypothetical protein